MNLVNNYGTPNNIEVALRMKEFLGNDHGMLKYWGIDIKEIKERIMYAPYYSGWKREHRFDELRERVMTIINDYLTSNRGTKNYNINKIKFFKDIPDGIEILIDYVDVSALRTMNIPTEIIYESIYRELPELFEE